MHNTETQPDHSWHRVRSLLRQAVAEPSWDLWLEPLAFREKQGATITVEAPEANHRWITDRFGRLLQSCAQSVLGPDGEIRVTAPGTGRRSGESAEPGGTPQTTRRRPEAEGGIDSPAHADASAALDRSARFDPRLTFDQFVIGECNRMAHAAALAVAEMPGLAYNPLFICGPPGLGKTHLLQSIVNYVATHGSGATARYTTVESFTNHFIGALHGGDIASFKETYRGVDVLVVDDVQFLESKVKTEEEFFHTFNALLGAGAQLVLSSDRPPRDMNALEDRLRERFEAGLVCDLRPPDLETRLTILRQRVRQDGLADDVQAGALRLLAKRVEGTVRALEGALIRVVAYGSLTGRTVDADLAREVLDEYYPQVKRRGCTVTEIQEHVCAAFSIPLDALVSSSRAAGPARARHVAMYLARELTTDSLPAIGRAFGGRSHTTVLHAYRRIAERIAADPETLALVDRLRRELQPHHGDRPA